MTNKKPTIAEMFAEILNTYDLTDEHRAFLEDRAEKATRKSTERKPTAKQIVNAAIADKVCEFMANEPNRLFTVSELLKVCPAFNAIPDVSASYANAIIKKLKDAHRVTRTESKGRAYFQYAQTEGEA